MGTHVVWEGKNFYDSGISTLTRSTVIYAYRAGGSEGGCTFVYIMRSCIKEEGGRTAGAHRIQYSYAPQVNRTQPPSRRILNFNLSRRMRLPAAAPAKPSSPTQAAPGTPVRRGACPTPPVLRAPVSAPARAPCHQKARQAEGEEVVSDLIYLVNGSHITQALCKELIFVLLLLLDIVSCHQVGQALAQQLQSRRSLWGS